MILVQQRIICSGLFVLVEVASSELDAFINILAYDLDDPDGVITYSLTETGGYPDNFEIGSTTGELKGVNLNEVLGVSFYPYHFPMNNYRLRNC